MSEWWNLEWNSSNLSMWVPLHLNSCFTFFDTVNTGPTEPPTTCPDLTVPANGMISYTMGTASVRPEGTIATFTCNNGYTLTGGSFSQCQNDRTWSGTAPTCQCEFHYILTVASPFLIQWTQDPLNHPPPVLTWLLWSMEWSATIWGLLVWDQWTLWPPTPVTLATLSMEAAPGLVGVMECGVGQLLLVKVS